MSVFGQKGDKVYIINKIIKNSTRGGAYCTNNIVQKCLSFTVSLFLIFGMVPQNAFGLDNHIEDASGNWTINTAQGLVEFQEAVNGGNDFTGKTVTLAADIDLAGTSWAPIGGTESTPFSGTFDGAEHTISNLNNGLFGYISSATIKNLNLRKVNGKSICDQAKDSSTITGCTVIEGNVSTGGICCNADSSIITRCVVCYLNIKGYGGVGGICASANSCTITKCVAANSSIYDSLGGTGPRIGPIVGSGGSVTNCYSNCSYDSLHSTDGLYGFNCSGVVFNKERPYFSGTRSPVKGVSAAEYEQKLREFVDANPEFVKWEKYIFTKTLKSSDFVCTHPKDMFYDGKGKTITIKPKDGMTDIGAVTIKCYKVNSDGTLGAASTTLPTDAGRYKAKFDVASGPTNYAATALPAMFF